MFVEYQIFTIHSWDTKVTSEISGICMWQTHVSVDCYQSP